MSRQKYEHRRWPIRIYLSPTNLRSAYQCVKSNNGAAGVDKMDTRFLKDYFINHKDKPVASILQGSYKPNPVFYPFFVFYMLGGSVI